MSDFNNEKYPSGSLKPKAETGVLNFLAKYPNFNGTGVTIAILDSGVDPNAVGLKVGNKSKLMFSCVLLTQASSFFCNVESSKWRTQSH